MKWLKRNLAFVGAILTVIYIVAIMTLGFFAAPALKFNEWGDFFAGFMSPVALAWLIGTLFIQRQELALQRDEMRAAQKIAQEQAVEQRKTAEANLNANLIAEKTALQNASGEYRNRLDEIKQLIINRLNISKSEVRKKLYSSFTPEYWSSPGPKSEYYSRIISGDAFSSPSLHENDKDMVLMTFSAILRYSKYEQLHVIDGRTESSIEVLYPLMKRFYRVFTEFYERAQEASMLILIDDDDKSLADSIEHYFTTRGEKQSDRADTRADSVTSSS
jgi:hypothetical protein